MGRVVHLQIDSIDYEALQSHFSMPMAEAAKKFGVSLTLFKRICRKHGIQRWPHRKLRSLHNKIADLQTRLTDNPGAGETQLAFQGFQELEAQRSQNPRFPDPRADLAHDRKRLAPGVTRSTDGVGRGDQPEISYEELKRYFNLPLTEAARKSGVCPTVFKKICRKHGIQKWPHRKLKSLQSKLVDLQYRISSNDEVREKDLQQRLNALKGLEEMAAVEPEAAHLSEEEAEEEDPELENPPPLQEPARAVKDFDVAPLAFNCDLPSPGAGLYTTPGNVTFETGHLQPMSRNPSVDAGLCDMLSDAPIMSRINSRDALCDMLSDAPIMSRINSRDALCDMLSDAPIASPIMSRINSRDALCDMHTDAPVGLITCWENHPYSSSIGVPS